MHLRSRSKTLIDKYFITFKYVAKKLREQLTACGYCWTLISRVMPFIRHIKPVTVARWDSKKEDVIAQSTQLKAQILPEVRVIFNAVKISLTNEELLSRDDIKEACTRLESVLAFKPEDGYIIGVIPSQEEVACDRLKQLLYMVARLGRKDLIRKYVTRSCVLYECDHEEALDPTKQTMSKVQHIRLFNRKTFIPSYFKWLELNDNFYKSIAGAWARLCDVEASWPTQKRDFFRKKALHYGNPEAAARSAILLTAHSYWLTVKTINRT